MPDFRTLVKSLFLCLTIGMASPVMAQEDVACENLWGATYMLVDKHVDELSFKEIVLQFLRKTDRTFNLGLQVFTNQDTVTISNQSGETLVLECGQFNEFGELALKRLLIYLKPMLTQPLSHPELRKYFCEYIGDFLISSIDETGWAMKETSSDTFLMYSSIIGCTEREDSTGSYRIVAIIDTSSSYLRGLRQGDLIVKIGSVPTSYLGMGYFRKLSSGYIGDSVLVTIQRGNEFKEFSLDVEKNTSRINEKQDTHVKMIADIPETGYILLGGFNSFNNQVIMDFVSSNEEKIKNLIIDARYSSGGMLKSVQQLAQWFFNEGDTLWVEDFRVSGTNFLSIDSQKRFIIGTGKGINQKIKISILISNNTAAGAEFFLIPFKEFGKAKFYGSVTSGNMNIHREYLLTLDTGRHGYHITVGKANSVSKSIREGFGIQPDVVLQTGQDALQYVLDELRNR